MNIFSARINQQILKKAQKTQEEICGAIVDGKVVFLDNKAPDRLNSFYMPDVPENAQAIFHSHPNGPFYPSQIDMVQQAAMDIPWGIACFDAEKSEVFWFGDGAPKQPLVGRGFRHGVSDCYELIRDFYKEIHGVDIMSVPRDWEWWHTEELYAKLFSKAGFTVVGIDEILPGDCFLASIRSKTPNHAGVYLGNGAILHHTCGRYGYEPSRLSVVEPANRWFNFIEKIVRYEKSDIDRTVGQRIRY